MPHTLHDFCPPTMAGKDHATRVSIEAVPVSMILAVIPFKQCSILGFHINRLGKCRRRKLEKLEKSLPVQGFQTSARDVAYCRVLQEVLQDVFKQVPL